jgi:hypothetical protein
MPARSPRRTSCPRCARRRRLITNRDRSRCCRSCRPRTRRPNEVFVIVFVYNNNRASNPNKRSADRPISWFRAGVRALLALARRERKTFSSTHVLPFNDRSTYDGQFWQIGRDLNCKSHYLTAQHMASSLPVTGECRDCSYSDRAMVCSELQ